ncbi:MAG: phosphoribosyl-AMP cyclohydrolase [Fibrobacterales bacterium]
MADNSSIINDVTFNTHGLVPAIACDATTGEMLMMAWMNEETLLQTIETGIMTYYSRSRSEIWVKGASSGNIQKVVSAHLDCDGDTLLFKVTPEGVGAACHEGYKSCFFRELKEGNWVTQGTPLFDPKEVYGTKNH